MTTKQVQQKEWFEQWEMLQDDELFLFQDWIYPHELTDFQDKEVLECGCGGGQHTGFCAPHVKYHTAVDLNTTELAQQRNQHHTNITYIEDDIATMNLHKTFDITFSIGVIHHTDNPDASVQNMIKHTKSGGKVIIWVYSQEGNYWVERWVEPLRKRFLTSMSRKNLLRLSSWITQLMYLPIYTVYLLPLKFLPFYEYFQNFRKLSFQRNTLNVFDKLNAPQVQFISQERAKSWINPSEFEDIHISPYKGVSWRISGTKK